MNECHKYRLILVIFAGVNQTSLFLKSFLFLCVCLVYFKRSKYKLNDEQKHDSKWQQKTTYTCVSQILIIPQHHRDYEFRQTSEGFCPVPLLGCDECWDQQVELPGGETPQSVKGLGISSLSVSAQMNNLTSSKNVWISPTWWNFEKYTCGSFG